MKQAERRRRQLLRRRARQLGQSLASAIAIASACAMSTTSALGAGRPAGKVYFTIYPGLGFGGPQYLKVKPSTLQMSGDASFILHRVHWSSWGGATAKGSGESAVETCNPTCAGGGVVGTASRITLSRLGRFDGRTVYQCFKIVSPGRRSIATERANESGCLPGASRLGRSARAIGSGRRANRQSVPKSANPNYCIPNTVAEGVVSDLRHISVRTACTVVRKLVAWLRGNHHVVVSCPGGNYVGLGSLEVHRFDGYRLSIKPDLGLVMSHGVRSFRVFGYPEAARACRLDRR
jgi:hypothetical protein